VTFRTGDSKERENLHRFCWGRHAQ